MTAADRPRFADAMHALGLAFQSEVPDVKAAVYFEALSEFDLDRVLAALRQSVKTCEFFPKVVEIIRLIEGTDVDAWETLVAEIRRVGYLGTPQLDNVTLQTVRSLAGSWRALCERLPADGPEHLGWRKRFAEAYALHAGRERDRQHMLAQGEPTTDPRQLGEGAGATVR